MNCVPEGVGHGFNKSISFSPLLSRFSFFLFRLPRSTISLQRIIRWKSTKRSDKPIDLLAADNFSENWSRIEVVMAGVGDGETANDAIPLRRLYYIRCTCVGSIVNRISPLSSVTTLWCVPSWKRIFLVAEGNECRRMHEFFPSPCRPQSSSSSSLLFHFNPK